MTNVRQRRNSCDKITHDFFFVRDWLYFAQDFDSETVSTNYKNSPPLFDVKEVYYVRIDKNKEKTCFGFTFFF